jgi:hypothetical protein
MAGQFIGRRKERGHARLPDLELTRVKGSLSRLGRWACPRSSVEDFGQVAEED